MVGARVEARWEGEWWPAIVDQVCEDAYEVEWVEEPEVFNRLDLEDVRAALFAVGRDESDGAETATVKPRFRGSVTFSSLDLRNVEGLREGAYHLVFCRHSGFMYLARAERAKLLEAIHAATADQGFLVVGHDDSSAAFERLMGNAQHAFCQNFTRQLTSNAFCVCAYDESIPRLE